MSQSTHRRLIITRSAVPLPVLPHRRARLVRPYVDGGQCRTLDVPLAPVRPAHAHTAHQGVTW